MKFEITSQRVLGPKIWTNLPPPIKNAENIFACKRMINDISQIFLANAINDLPRRLLEDSRSPDTISVYHI